MSKGQRYYFTREDFDTWVKPCYCHDDEPCDCFPSFKKARSAAIRYLKELIADCRIKLDEIRELDEDDA
jgi:hypothetical protein